MPTRKAPTPQSSGLKGEVTTHKAPKGPKPPKVDVTKPDPTPGTKDNTGGHAPTGGADPAADK